MEIWQGYLHEDCNYAAAENQPYSYYTDFQILIFKIMIGVIWVYRLITIPLLVIGIHGGIKTFIKFKNRTYQKQITAFVLLGFFRAVRESPLQSESQLLALILGA